MCSQAVASVEAVDLAAGCSKAGPERSAGRIEKRGPSFLASQYAAVGGAQQ